MSRLTDTIDTPIYECKLPSTGETIKFRPYVVSEERALLMAQESEDNAAMLNTLDGVVRACIVFPKKIPRLTTFDIEFLFVQIRIKAVDENSLLTFTCNSCKEEVPIAIPLKNIFVDGLKEKAGLLKLDTNLAVLLQYPTIGELTAGEGKKKAVAASLKTVYKGDSVLNAEDFTEDEVMEFFDKLFPWQFEKIQEFFDEIPKTTIKVDWACPSCNHEHKHTLTGINSFF